MPESDSSEDLVSVYEAKSISEASIVAGLLRSHGIEAVIDGEMRSSLAGYLPTADTRPHVLVLESDSQEALELLEKEGRPTFRRRSTKASTRLPAFKLALPVLLIVSIGLVWYNVHLQRELTRLSGNSESLYKWSEHLSTESCDVYIYNETLHKSAEYCDPGNQGFYTLTKDYTINGELNSIYYDSNRDGYYDVTESYNRDGDLTHRYEDRNGASGMRSWSSTATADRSDTSTEISITSMMLTKSFHEFIVPAGQLSIDAGAERAIHRVCVDS